ncbi:glycosyltransferase family 2 protein [Rhodobacteraceae bacterium NNCM2]|nr:glycosyltransferase family 2 protein [Coraliihabitans acroporae]
MRRETPHVSICLTSISGRCATLHQTIRSLLAQDYPAFDVTLYISDHAHMLDKGITRIPEALAGLRAESDGRFEILYTANTGPYRKLMPRLAGLRGREALVATADDDTLYPGDWLARLVERYVRHRCIISYRGHPMLHDETGFVRYRRWMTTRAKRREGMFLLPTGKDGVLYNSRFFHPAVLRVDRALELAPTTDDLWWRWHSAALGVPVHMINLDYATSTLPEVEWEGSLYDNYNRAGENDRVVARLSQYGREDLGFSFFQEA